MPDRDTDDVPATPVRTTTAAPILAVVVSHGHTRQLRELVRSLASVTRVRVVLVENKRGVDHSWAPGGVRVLSGHPNVGYGAAVNYALTDAADQEPAPEWLVVANSDVALPPDTAAELPDLLNAATSADAVAFPVRTSAGAPARSAAVLPTVATSLYTAVRGELAAVRRWPHLCYPPGAFFAMRTATYLDIGGFDPGYFLYWEETDLFQRLYAAGGRLAWAPPSLAVVHDGAGSTGRSGVLDLEFGRGAGRYGRSHRDETGRTWLAAYATQLILLICRKVATGRYGCAARAARILAGLAAVRLAPGWEPSVRRWRAASAAERARLGGLPGPPPSTPARS